MQKTPLQVYNPTYQPFYERLVLINTYLSNSKSI